MVQSSLDRFEKWARQAHAPWFYLFQIFDFRKKNDFFHFVTESWYEKSN